MYEITQHSPQINILYVKQNEWTPFSRESFLSLGIGAHVGAHLYPVGDRHGNKEETAEFGY